MGKFWILFKKELKELVTLKMVLPLIVMTLIFAFIGQLIEDEQGKINEPLNIGILNEDKGGVFENFVEETWDGQFNFNEYNLSLNESLEVSRESDDFAFVYIPESFSENLNELDVPKLEIYTYIKSFSFVSTIQSAKIDRLKLTLNDFLSNNLIKDRIADTDPEKLKKPVNLKDYIVLKDSMAQISFQSVIGFIQSQTTFVPIILFLIIVIASQMVATTIASEKENKSFEILLSSPLDRKIIVLAKIMASGFMALIFAGFYMFGFGYYMNSMSGGLLSQASPAFDALVQLGVVISPFEYLLIGVSLFLAILSALVISIILGTMADDVKSVQAVTTPLMILILLPYFITMFLDLSSIPYVIRYIVYAIPFSYPFLSIQKVIMDEFAFIFFGLIYQIIFFAVFVVLASKVFTSDLILTWRFGSRKNNSDK
jgi:ABC-2 type transport system permease protein